LFGCARAQQIKNVLVGQLDNLGYAPSHLVGRLRSPLSQLGIQLFG
jgi:hypothetical protein